MQTAPAPLLLAQPGIRFALVNLAIVTATVASRLSGFDPWHSVLAVAAVAGLVAIGLPVAACAGCGVIAWAFVTGFVENRFGDLTTTRADLGRLALAVMLAALVARLGRSVVRKS